MNGTNQYTHTSINIHTRTHIHTSINTYTHTNTHTHTHTQIQFLIREMATEVKWNGSTVKKGKFSGLS